MKNLSIKTKILNLFREFFKIGIFEKWLVIILEKRNNFHWFVTKLVPNHYQYQEGTMRFATRNGIRFHLDLSEYLEHSIYFNLEVEPKEKLYAIPLPTDVVFDIGGNIGETILNFGKKLSTGKVYGFEPVPRIFDKLQKNVSLNQFSTIQIENIALSDNTEVLNFTYQTNKNSGGTRMRKAEDAIHFHANHQVKAMPLDKYVEENNINKIDFIKIDVEGFELNVLRGAEKSIRHFQPKMVIEIDDAMLREQHTNAREVLRFVDNLQYKLINFNENQPIDFKMNFTNCHFDVLAIPKK